jgi:hypothetical protein
MKVFGVENNVYDAVDAVVKYGLAVVEGTKIPATNYTKRVIQCLKPYTDVSPIEGCQNVPNNGYLYYVFDNKKFSIGDDALKNLVLEIDAANP